MKLSVLFGHWQLHSSLLPIGCQTHYGQSPADVQSTPFPSSHSWMTSQATFWRNGTSIVSYTCQMCYCHRRCWNRNSPFGLCQLHHTHLQWNSCKELEILLSEFNLVHILSSLWHLFTRKATEDGIVAFDVKHQEEVMLIPYMLIVASNNLMQVEECSHGGLWCNYFCHTCKGGGTIAEKKMDQEYSDIFKVHYLVLFWTEMASLPSVGSCMPLRICALISNNRLSFPSSLVEQTKSTNPSANLAFVTPPLPQLSIPFLYLARHFRREQQESPPCPRLRLQHVWNTNLSLSLAANPSMTWLIHFSGCKDLVSTSICQQISSTLFCAVLSSISGDKQHIFLTRPS